ncbi:hypothetical protein V2J09_001328 [Rumex salicifolius]
MPVGLFNQHGGLVLHYLCDSYEGGKRRPEYEIRTPISSSDTTPQKLQFESMQRLIHMETCIMGYDIDKKVFSRRLELSEEARKGSDGRHGRSLHIFKWRGKVLSLARLQHLTTIMSRKWVRIKDTVFTMWVLEEEECNTPDLHRKCHTPVTSDFIVQSHPRLDPNNICLK